MPQVIEIFIERDLSYKLRGCFYNVRNKYGRFHHERVYDRVLSEQFEMYSIPFIDKPKIAVYSVLFLPMIGNILSPFSKIIRVSV